MSVSVHLDELVLERPEGSPPALLLAPLADALAAHGVPDATAVAAGVVEALTVQGALP